jgi:hypothetical protein
MRPLASLMLMTCLACSGSDSTGPVPGWSGTGPASGGGEGDASPYPSVAGVYAVNGGFDRSSAWPLRGTLSITQATTASGDLGGTASLTYDLGTGPVTRSGLLLYKASVSRQGAVAFTLVIGGSFDVWTFGGTVIGPSIAGRHSLGIFGSSPFTGTWTAQR